MATGSFTIRLGVKDQEVVSRALQSVGTDGEKALKKLERAAGTGSKGFQAMTVAQREFASGLQGLTANAGGLGTALSALGPAGLAAAAGIGALAAGFTAAMRRAREAITELDVLDDTANKLGLGVEALQELRYAAEQTGVSMQTFDMAMQRFTRRTAEAAVGTGEAKAALAEMGIALRDSAGNLRSTEDVFYDVADAISGIEDPATRLRLAVKLFDSEGAKVVNTLMLTGAGIREVAQEGRDLGAVMDQHMVKTGSEAADQLAALERVINTQLNQAVVDLGPVLITMAEAFATVSRAVADLVDQFRALENQSSRGLKSRLDEINQTLADPGLLDIIEAGGEKALRRKKTREKRNVEMILESRSYEGLGVRRSPAPAPAAAPGQETRPAARSSGGGARQTAPSAPDPLAFMKPPSQTAAQALEDVLEAQEQLRERSLQVLDSIREAHLRSNGEIEQVINLRRDRELAALEELRLTEAEAAEARVKINADADQEIFEHKDAAIRNQAEREQQVLQTSISAYGGMARSVASAFAEMEQAGEVSIGRLTELIVNLVTQLAELEANTGGISSLISSIVGAASAVGGAAAGGGGSTYATSPAAGAAAARMHSGGIVGVDAGRRSTYALSAFQNAPRLHSGFMPDEFPAVLQRGEGVFTPAQMRALGAAAAAPRVSVVVNNNAPVTVETETRSEGNDLALLFKLDSMTSQLARGEGSALNRAIKDVTGTRSQGIKR